VGALGLEIGGLAEGLDAVEAHLQRARGGEAAADGDDAQQNRDADIARRQRRYSCQRSVKEREGP